jgi:hypothetical protein
MCVCTCVCVCVCVCVCRSMYYASELSRHSSAAADPSTNGTIRDQRGGGGVGGGEREMSSLTLESYLSRSR